MAEHTPGPWRASQGGGIYAGEQIVALTKGVDDNEKFPNAQIKEYGETSKANCQLLAAAPELLNALLDCVELMAADDDNQPTDSAWDAGIEVARAAIAKAEAA